jgi:hypothetical protein
VVELGDERANDAAAECSPLIDRKDRQVAGAGETAGVELRSQFGDRAAGCCSMTASEEG